MQREMFNARLEQTKAIVEMGLNLAAGLKKQVDAGQMTKEAALAEFGRRANSMTYDKGAGYLFGTGYNGITVLSPDPKQVGANRMDVVTNGRMLSRELMDGVKAKGEILLTYEYMKPGTEKPIRKIGTPWPSPALTCMSAPAPISTTSTPSCSRSCGCLVWPFSALPWSPAASPG